MKAIPITPATLEVARRVIWFEPPEKALAGPARFVAYAMTYARHEDMRLIRRYLSDEDLRRLQKEFENLRRAAEARRR